MHLADFDESLVGGQILTDPQARSMSASLELSTHMEKVTQKYLRNEYATIDEYNAVAGEVAEPYRVRGRRRLPRPASTRRPPLRLAAISAERHPLRRHHPGRPRPPTETTPARHAPRSPPVQRLGPRLGRFQKLNWADPDFSKHPLVLDPPPAGRVRHPA